MYSVESGISGIIYRRYSSNCLPIWPLNPAIRGIFLNINDMSWNPGGGTLDQGEILNPRKNTANLIREGRWILCTIQNEKRLISVYRSTLLKSFNDPLQNKGRIKVFFRSNIVCLTMFHQNLFNYIMENLIWWDGPFKNEDSSVREPIFYDPEIDGLQCTTLQLYIAVQCARKQ